MADDGFCGILQEWTSVRVIEHYPLTKLSHSNAFFQDNAFESYMYIYKHASGLVQRVMIQISAKN